MLNDDDRSQVWSRHIGWTMIVYELSIVYIACVVMCRESSKDIDHIIRYLMQLPIYWESIL